MVNFANYFVKTQPQIAGRWSANALWEKFAQAKKAVRDAYFKAVGKATSESLTGESIASQINHLITKPARHQLLHRCKSTIKGYGKLQQQQQMSFRIGRWGRGEGPFGRDYIWRRLRTGHLVGFATLFLVHEEKTAEEVAFLERMKTYTKLCENIKTLFQPGVDVHPSSGDSTLGTSIADFNLGKCIAVGSNGAVYEAENNDGTESIEEMGVNIRKKKAKKSIKKVSRSGSTTAGSRKKFAIKMVSNYDSSNAGNIYRQTMAELITCGRGAISGLSRDWQNGSRTRMKRLPSHPNVIKVERAIVDKVPNHPEFAKMHPAWLPQPTGYGRSTAMFLVMKRYEWTLKELLKNSQLGLRKQNLLALQLLHGVAHLERNNVAHRDLKSNNILIEQDSSTVNLPRVVISDFGCAFVPGPDEDLTFPFLSPKYDIRNGNPEIQPPEISKCIPGPHSVLDYGKSDAWAAGLLLCKIMGIDRNRLDLNATEDKPDEFEFIKRLIKLLLKKDPKERITCAEAAAILHLELFGPKFCQENDSMKSPSGKGADVTITDWLLMHAIETVAYKSTEWGKNSVVCELFTNFLSALSYSQLCSAFMAWQSLKM